MNKKIGWTKLAIALVLCGGLLGCSNSVTGETQIEASKEVNMKQNTPEITGELVTLTGVVISKPWSKSYESWNAGGGTYYVLDVGEAELDEANRSAEEGVILRESEEIDRDSFADYEGETVQVEGYFVESQPYVPESPMEQYPTGMNGEPLPRGSGFQVHSITRLD